MKNRLLFSTALVAVLSATNVYAADLTGKVERPDNINIGSSTEYTINNAYSEQSGYLDEGTLYTSTVNVDKGGKLTVSSSDIVADGSGDAVTLKGTVILDGTSIMAGNKYPDAKQNMIIDGADITFNTTSDLLSATGDLQVSNASINASSLVADDEGDDEDLSGLRALGNITIDNSKIDMSDLMIVSGLDNPDGAGEPLGEGNITISGNSDIKVKEIGVYGKGDININGGNITAQDIGAEQGNITISNGSVNVIEGGEGLYAHDKLNIKGGTVNMSGNGNRIGGTNIAMSGGTLNIEDSTLNSKNQAVVVRGGTANITRTTINYNNTFNGYYDDYYTSNWDTGNDLPPAALVVGNRSTSAYRYPAVANLTATTFNLEAGSRSIACYIWGNPEEGLGATLTYDAETNLDEYNIFGGGQYTINGASTGATDTDPFSTYDSVSKVLPTIGNNYTIYLYEDETYTTRTGFAIHDGTDYIIVNNMHGLSSLYATLSDGNGYEGTLSNVEGESLFDVSFTDPTKIDIANYYFSQNVNEILSIDSFSPTNGECTTEEFDIMSWLYGAYSEAELLHLLAFGGSFDSTGTQGTYVYSNVEITSVTASSAYITVNMPMLETAFYYEITNIGTTTNSILEDYIVNGEVPVAPNNSFTRFMNSNFGVDSENKYNYTMEGTVTGLFMDSATSDLYSLQNGEYEVLYKYTDDMVYQHTTTLAEDYVYVNTNTGVSVYTGAEGNFELYDSASGYTWVDYLYSMADLNGSIYDFVADTEDENTYTSEDETALDTVDGLYGVNFAQGGNNPSGLTVVVDETANTLNIEMILYSVSATVSEMDGVVFYLLDVTIKDIGTTTIDITL